jgi:class 3 adenylate cyclase
VGAVSSVSGAADIAVLGDTPNTAAYLTSQAAPGELLMSEEAFQVSGMDIRRLESRRLTLKSREQPVTAWVRTPNARD